MHRSSRRVILFINLIFVLLGISCSNDKSIKEQSRNQLSKKSEKSEMQLRYENAIARIDQEKVSYTNYVDPKEIEAQLLEKQGDERFKAMVDYSVALLKEGRTDSSIGKFNYLLDLLSKESSKEAEDFSYTLKKVLAIAYMRKAEQENCIANHNDESCIIPISKKAIHVREEGSRKTIKTLLELLEDRPDDYETQYILNIAYMTLGEYPNKVPKKYLLPQDYFTSKASLSRFRDIAGPLGIAVNRLSGGTCIDDFNNDGYLDIIASSWGLHDQIEYFINDQQGGFVKATKEAGLSGIYGGLNLRHTDFNNDGNIDFIILRGAWLDSEGKIPNSLMRNNGDGTFTDITIEAGVYSERPTQTAVWADFNLDGFVDLFIGNESSPTEMNECELYLNNGNETFTNITTTSGINEYGYFKGVGVGDVNNDLLPDLYLSNLMGGNSLFINISQENKIQFKKATNNISISEPIISFPTWMFDYNNDGFDDIFVSGYSNDKYSPASLMMKHGKEGYSENRPYLYKNLGNGSFEEVGLKMKLNEPVATMGCNFGDLNNDGYLDFYLATGNPNYYSIVPNKMYMNLNGEEYADVTYSGGFGHIQKGHSVGWGDLDNDGDQDIYTVLGGAYTGDFFSNVLFENPIGNENNWINIKLEGTTANKLGIGSKIIISINESGEKRKIYHNVGFDASFGGNSILAEIGLGKADIIESIEVMWADQSKSKSIFKNISVNQFILIKQNETEVQKLNYKKIDFK